MLEFLHQGDNVNGLMRICEEVQMCLLSFNYDTDYGGLLENNSDSFQG